MNIATFQDDLLELREFSERLGRFIDTEHEFVEGSLVVALSSRFGSGKSTFLRMWRSAMEDGDENRPLVVSLNAWESDYNGDPLFAIVSALAEAVREKGEAADALLEAAKDFGWFATAIGSQLVNVLTGIDPVAAGEVAQRKRAERIEGAHQTMDAFSIYEARRNAMYSLKRAIREIVASSKPKVLFLVDELDRCRPDYAITYLETIKHLFDTSGAVFILAADRQQLENSAKTAFGIDLDFEEYYRKFVHREVELPPISEASYIRLAERYVNFYLEREGARFCFLGLDHQSVGYISGLIGALKLTPRQIQEVFRTLGHLFDTTEENRGRLYWCLGVGSIAMAVFKIGAPDKFHALGGERLDAGEALQFIKNSIGQSYPEWWFAIFLTGGGLYANEGEVPEDVMKRAGLTDDQSHSSHGDLSHFRSGWGRRSSGRFKEIYEKIQQVSQWS
ncbi:KAP family P-loop NTPase fold protein [Haliea salexigens]|uniref:KAP family P-loop NTPase fold protein n=1 Tax=Haliea salexigens TaxID=287487 RepID=UPI00130DEC71|nr:P-loop NTPase fold protein [Haliea salexigens]